MDKAELKRQYKAARRDVYSPTSDLRELPTYVRHCLGRAGYTTKAQIARLPDVELVKVRNLGETSFIHVRTLIPYDPDYPQKDAE